MVSVRRNARANKMVEAILVNLFTTFRTRHKAGEHPVAWVRLAHLFKRRFAVLNFALEMLDAAAGNSPADYHDIDNDP